MQTDRNLKSNFRWAIISILFFLNIISYIDRSAMAYAVHYIMPSLRLSFAEMGTVLSAFGIGYMITTFLGGLMVDHYGVRKTLFMFSLLWVVAMGATGLAVGFFSAYLARFCLGLGEGPNFPAVARTVANWLPMRSRAKTLASTLVSVPLSLAIGGPIITFLIVTTNWRWMFLILASLLLLWWPFWWIFYSDHPRQSKFVNQAEIDYIEQDSKKIFKKPSIRKIPWRIFLRNSTLLANNWGFFVFGYSMFFYLNWLPAFLEKNYHLNITQIGLFSFLPWGLGGLFLWIGGYISDFVFKKTGNLRSSRSYLIIIGQLMSLVCIFPILVWKNLLITLISISLAVAFNLSTNSAFYAVNVDIVPRRSGASLGIMNACFAIAGILAPALTGFLVQVTDDFYSAFVLILFLILSAVIIVSFFHQPDKDRLKIAKKILKLDRKKF